MNGVTYLLKHNHSEKVIKAHHSQLRRYYTPPSYITRHPYWLVLEGSIKNKLNTEGIVSDDASSQDNIKFSDTGSEDISFASDSSELSPGAVEYRSEKTHV